MPSYHQVLIHVVFSTQYRRSVLTANYRDDLFGYIGGTVKEHQASLLKAGGVEDHVHLLIGTHPRFAIASTIQLLKTNSSKWINDKKKTGRKFHWQSGYGAFSVSKSMVPQVKRYIANQQEHHRKTTFMDEYLKMLRLHGIDFDLKYVFDKEIIA